VTRLFIELYLDEDVDVLVAQLIRARGFTVRTTAEAGQLHASDAMQLAYAGDHGMELLTHNRIDFEALHNTYAASGRHHGGVIVAVRRSPYELTRRLLLILNQVTADEMEGQVRYV
jgi:hypothetical protein